MRPPVPSAPTPALLGVLGFIAAVGPFATDMYLASFTDIAADLGTPAASVQLTLTAFLLGMGGGQLVLGPLSDRLGRRRVLLAAFTVFAASSTAMVFAPSIEVFIALRLVQGLSGAGGVVLARAIAVDISDARSAVRALSLIATVVGLGPLIAPPIGGAVATAWGWRGVIAVLAVIALTMLVLTWFAVPETLPPEHRQRGGLGPLVHGFGALLRDIPFVAYVLCFSLAFAAMMSYIAASPFVGQAILRMSPLGYSLGFATSATALILANLVNARVAPRWGAGRMLTVGLALTVGAAAAMATLMLTGALAPASFIGCAFVLIGGTGLIMSNASALALARTDHATRGAGSALLGATQFALGGLVSPLVGLAGEHSAVPMTVIILSGTLLASGAAVVAARAGRDV